MLSAIASAAGSPRRVEIHAMRRPASSGVWLSAALFQPTPVLGVEERGGPHAAPLGGAAKRSPRAHELGRVGGAGGGGVGGALRQSGAVCFRLLLLLLLRLLRASSVNVCWLLVLAGSYSQQGSTMWPDGASSSWKTSVPSGSEFATS